MEPCILPSLPVQWADRSIPGQAKSGVSFPLPGCQSSPSGRIVVSRSTHCEALRDGLRWSLQQSAMKTLPEAMIAEDDPRVISQDKRCFRLPNILVPVHRYCCARHSHGYMLACDRYNWLHMHFSGFAVWSILQLCRVPDFSATDGTSLLLQARSGALQLVEVCGTSCTACWLKSSSKAPSACLQRQGGGVTVPRHTQDF